MCLSPRTDDGWSSVGSAFSSRCLCCCVALFEAVCQPTRVSTFPPSHSWWDQLRSGCGALMDLATLLAMTSGNGLQRYFWWLVPSKTFSKSQPKHLVVYDDTPPTVQQSINYKIRCFTPTLPKRWQAERFGGRDWLRGMWGVDDRCRRFWCGDSAPGMALSSGSREGWSTIHRKTVSHWVICGAVLQWYKD